MEHMRCMDKRQICGSMSRGESISHTEHLISAAVVESMCRPSLTAKRFPSGNSWQLNLMRVQYLVVVLRVFHAQSWLKGDSVQIVREQRWAAS